MSDNQTTVEPHFGVAAEFPSAGEPEPAGHEPNPLGKLASRLARELEAAGAMGIVIAVDRTRSTYRIATPAWSHLIRESGGRYSVLIRTTPPEALEATALTLNVLCEVDRQLVVLDRALTALIGFTISGLRGLGVEVSDAGDAEAEPAAEPAVELEVTPSATEPTQPTE